MPQNYVPVNNKKRAYKACCTADLESAAEAVKAGMSYCKACKNFDMRKFTLHDFIKNGGVKSAGRSTLSSTEDEKAIAELVNTVAEWGFPLGPMEIKLIAKDLMDSKGEVSHCQDNMPGDDWFAGFMNRNKNAVRNASNIKCSRSKVHAVDITSFFNELEKALQGAGIEELIPENIYNHDKTNFTNDPRKTPVIVRRVRKRVENCQEVSMRSFSIMWCGSASGELLPPMVVCKTMNCYEGWVQGGPKNAIYDSANSGWFLF